MGAAGGSFRQPAEDDGRSGSTLARLGAETITERQVKRILPWIVSVAIHLSLVVLAVFVTWGVTRQSQDDSSVLIIADFDALAYDPIGRVVTEAEPQADPRAESLMTVENLDEHIEEQWRESETNPWPLIADAWPASPPSSDAFAPVAEPNTATFVGLSSSNAREIVYVIDASGSMVPYLQIVIEELSRSLANLSHQQQFSIIFFRGAEVIQLPPEGKLVQAIPRETSRALQWANRNQLATGGTNPLAALQQALALSPDVVFLLSQDITGYGPFEVDQNDLMALLDRLNPVNDRTAQRRVRINCIQFLDPDPLQMMKRIAEAHGGPLGYKFLTREELGLTPGADIPTPEDLE